MNKERIKIECLKIASENWGETEQIIKQAKELFNYVTGEEETAYTFNLSYNEMAKMLNGEKEDETLKQLNELEAYNEKGRTLVIKDALIKMYTILLEDKEQERQKKIYTKMMKQYDEVLLKTCERIKKAYRNK
jgi:hypothetical protein